MVSRDDGSAVIGEQSELRQLARGSSLNLAGSFVSAVLNLILPVVITRSLALQDAGLFFQVTALFAIVVNIGAFGADTGVLRFLPRCLVLEERDRVRPFMMVALVPPLIATALLVLLLLSLADPLSQWMTDSPETAETLADVLLVLLPWAPVTVVYMIAIASTRGLRSLRPLVLFEKIGRSLFETGFVAAAALTTGSIVVVMIAWVSPYLFMLVVVAVWLVRRLRTLGCVTSASVSYKATFVEFWRFSLPRAASRVCSVALQRADILVIGALRGPADAAIYAAATRFLVLGLVFVQAIQQVMAPRISETLAVGDVSRAQLIYRTTTTWLTLVSWPIYLLVIPFATLLMGVFGEGYEGGGPAAAVLCAAMLIATACGPVDTMLLMGGRSGLSLINTSLALAVDLALVFLLVPTLGVFGAALSWACAIAVNNLLPLWQVHRRQGLHPFGPGTVTAMLLSFVGFGGPVILARLVLGDTLLGLVVALSIGTIVYALLVFRFRRPLKVQVLIAILGRRRRGHSGAHI